MLKKIDAITIAGEEDTILVPSENCEERQTLLRDVVVVDVRVRRALDSIGPGYARAGFPTSIHMRDKTARKYGLLNEDNDKVILKPVETLEDRIVQLLEDLGVSFE